MKNVLTLKKRFSLLSKMLLSGSLLLSMGFAALAQSPYCDPYYASQGGNCTTYNMSVNALEILQGSTTIYSRAHNTGGYNGCDAATGQYFLKSSSSMFSFKSGATYSFGFTTGNQYAVGVGVWIDLNADNDFADAGEWLSAGWCTPYLQPNTTTLAYFTLKVPAGSTTGVTRMRIRSTYSSCTANDNSCSTYNYGEAEDYTITITSDPNDAGVTVLTTPQCGPEVKATIANLGNNAITPVQVGWSVNGSYQTPNTYSTSLSPAGTANITLKNTGGTDYNFVDGQTYTLKVFTYDPNNVTDVDKSNDTARVTFKYLGPSGVPSTTPTTKCGPGRAPLTCTSSFATDSIIWYNAATGGNKVASGKNTLSPPLFLGVNTFYAQSFKMGAKSVLANNLTGSYTYVASGYAYNGGFANITPKTGMFVDSFRVRIYTNAPVTYSILMRTGAYVTNMTGWTTLVSNVTSTKISLVSGYYIATLPIPETMLNGGTTYGFFIYTNQNPLWTFQYGSSTVSNADLTLYTQDYSFGNSTPMDYTGYTYALNLEVNYRTAICPSTRVPAVITVKPSPNGAGFTKGTPFQTMQPNTTGTLSSPDIVAKGDKLTYDLTPPKGYNNSDYGNTWISGTPVVKSKKGFTIDPKYWQWAPPSGGNAGKLTFSPDKFIVDSLYIISLQIRDLGPHYCDSTILRHIFVAPRPVPDFKFNSPICDGDAVLFNDASTISSGGLSYKWDFATGNAADTATINTTVFTFPTFGTYMVTLSTTSTPYGYKESITIPVVVTEIPKIGFKVLNACEKVAVKFNNSTTIGTGGITYAWDFGDPSTTLDKSTLENPSYTYANPGAYKVTLRATSSGCTSELTKNANQFPTPKANFTFPGLICDKSDVQFTNGSTIKMGNMGYTWNFGDGGISNFANPVHQFATSTPKQVKMKAVSEFGCVDSLSQTITLSVAPKADFIWGAACNLSNTDFTFTGSKPSGYLTSFNWNFAGEGTTTLENPSKLFNIVGRKDVTLTLLSNNGCSDVITKEVNVKLQSKAAFEVLDVCEDDDAVFINKSTVSQGNLLFNWKFGDNTTSAAQSPRHRYNIGGIPTTFNVTLVAVVPGGCSDSVNLPVSVNAKPISNFIFSTSGRKVTFTSTQAGNTVYNWRFGDGGNANVANPVYDYLNFPTGKYKACLAVVNAAGCFSETCKDVFISGSINKVTKLTGVQVYPNPNKGSFTVTIEDPKSDISISVYNLLGEVVKTISTNPLKSTYSIDLNVANGVYLVKVTNGGLTSTQKVTINK